MKVSIIRQARKSTQPYWELETLQQAAQQREVQSEVLTIASLNNLPLTAQQLGDIVVWRSSELPEGPDKMIATQHLSPARVWLNDRIIKQPFLSDKLYQQRLVAEKTQIPTIPTWHFTSVKDLQSALAAGQLQFPLIQKPRRGAQGHGISLLKSAADITVTDDLIRTYIFQPFIKNQGDYRVLIVGGVVLGAIKRTATPGSFLNNISQGATAEAVTEPTLMAALRLIAGQVTSLCELHLFGLDILQSEADGELYFLELNTLPQWQGFAQATGTPVSQTIIDTGVALHNRTAQPLPQLITDYYTKNLSYLPFDKQVHWNSRLWLWSSDPGARTWLREHHDHYVGATPEATKTKIQTLATANIGQAQNRNFAALRLTAYADYPHLMDYNRILFSTLFADTLYGQNITPIVNEVVPVSELLQYRERLLNDAPRVAIFATHAVNYLYLSQRYFIREPLPAIIPETIYQVAQTAYQNFHEPQYWHLQLYLLTHSIIGASNFYQQAAPSDQPIYHQILKLAETVIRDHYYDLSLDIKYEFLIAAKLLGQTSDLETIIAGEAARSLSPLGNFLVNRLNGGRRSLKHNFHASEHSNVLYVMNSRPYNPPQITV